MIITMKIRSYWQYETAKWDEETESFINRKKSPIEEKWLDVELVDYSKKHPIVRFHGGPTGHESYYLKDLLLHDFKPEGLFCICGGTVNSWPRCWVESEALSQIVKQFEKEVKCL